MNGVEAIKAMVKASGKSMSSISLAMNKSRSYIAVKITQEKDPYVTTLVKIANACGYDVRLVKKDGSKSVTIAPPKQ